MKEREADKSSIRGDRKEMEEKWRHRRKGKRRRDEIEAKKAKVQKRSERKERGS